MKKFDKNKYVFIFQLLLVLMVALFLIFNIFFAIVQPEVKYEKLSYGEKLSCHFAYFTTQTNYFVILFFLFNLLKIKIIDTKPTFELRLALTVYITITCLVFWIGIFSITFNYQEIEANFKNGKLVDIYRWVSTTVLHLIIPMAMIIHFIKNSGDKIISLKKQHRFWLWVVASYPILYAIIIMFRGEIRNLDHAPLDTLYPYFFLNHYEHEGYYKFIMLALVLIIFLALIFGLQYLYLKINNQRYRTKKRKQGKIFIEEENYN